MNDNRIYYGEYSLKHWINLMLAGNIVLPEYQRYFVWDQKRVRTLIDTFKSKEFVPPVTIGALNKEGAKQNLILDGQQRLTSVLLAYLELFPDKEAYKRSRVLLASEVHDDYDEEDVEQLDNVLNWTFARLIEKGRTKAAITAACSVDSAVRSYQSFPFALLTDEFFENTFLGFSYLVPHNATDTEQQKYYSSVFRHINIQGVQLLPQESRASLYFLNQDLSALFAPEFCKTIKIKTSTADATLDFVRYLALLSQYKKDAAVDKLARGFKPLMELYYEDYIYSVVEERVPDRFVAFETVFPNKAYQPALDKLTEAIEQLGIASDSFDSIINMDIYFFGLVYQVVFKSRGIDETKKDELKKEIEKTIFKLRGDTAHTRTPGAFKYLRARVSTSIEIYKKYTR